MESWQTNEAAL